MNAPDNLYHTESTIRDMFRDLVNMTDTFRDLTAGTFKGIVVKEADDDWTTDVAAIGGFVFTYIEHLGETPLDQTIDRCIEGGETPTLEDVPSSVFDYFVVDVFFNRPPENISGLYKALFSKYGFRIHGADFFGSERLRLRVKR